MSEKNFFVPVSEKLHQKVKEYCIKHKISISGLIIELLNERILTKRIQNDTSRT